ncbi:MAG TPA: ATP-binding protein [Rudaea sp.]|nr:ATP-binding protein [Rudaea sp.]
MKPIAWACWALAALATEPGAQDLAAASGSAAVSVQVSLHVSDVPPADDEGWAPIDLPQLFDDDDFGGTDKAWLRLQFDLARPPSAAWAVYIPRQKQNVAVFVGHNLIGTSGHVDEPSSETWNYPQLFEVPPYMLHAGRNDVFVHWYGSEDEISYMSQIYVGPAALLKPIQSRRYALQIEGPVVVSVVCGAVGLFMLALWLRQRKDDVFGWFGVVCLLWVLRNAHLWMREPPLPKRAWAMISHASLGWLVAALSLFAFRLMSLRYPRAELGLAFYAAAGTLALALAPVGTLGYMKELYFLGLLPIAAVLIGFLCWNAWRMRTFTIGLLTLGAIVCLGLGAFDFYALTVLYDKVEQVYLMPYGALLFTLTAGWAVIDRMVTDRRALQALNASLEERVAARERELAESYARAAELNRQAAVSEERRRIMRDMHDGLGAQLMSSISLAERGALSPGEVAELLRECVDDLRLAIDSLKPLGDDLNAMLGNFRYRFENRLAAAGLALDWSVEELPRHPALTPQVVLHIMRIVQEALANVIKHAGASRMRIEARFDRRREALCIGISDDGRGFDADGVRPGEGLASMNSRAAHIGATLAVVAEHGTTVTFCLPLPGAQAKLADS